MHGKRSERAEMFSQSTPGRERGVFRQTTLITDLEERRASILRRGRRLEYFTIAYNSLEGLISVMLGVMAGSIALVGFGIDSGIEVTSGAALLWRLHGDKDDARSERKERITLQIVGVCFLVLAAYVGYEAVASLLNREAPETSVLGIMLAIASLIVMPLLTRAKRQVAREIGSAAMTADAKQTEFCVYLSAILLGGLVLNALLGWWWADPVAALIMVPIIGKEGLEALRGETCCVE
jgi:divalent metal cation (Fe/Co/Zn/Cd) transporter